MREDGLAKLKGSKRMSRRAQWIARNLGYRIELTERQIELCRRWNEPAPDESEQDKGRSLRRSERGLVAEALTKQVGFLLLGLLLLIFIGWWLKAHGL